jgi:Kdo2-lipid IVA lauroyltransferase/acyltransferase
MLEAFTDFSAKVTFFFLRRYRKRMEETLSSLNAASGGRAGTNKDLARRAWRNFGRSAYETARTLYCSKEQIRAMVAIEGEEHLKQALQKGKGVIALSAHLGNFTMIGPRLAAEGYAFSALVKQPRDARFAKLGDEHRMKVGVSTIPAKPRRKSVRYLLNALRKNDVVLLIADEFKGGKFAVQFLGRTALAPRGPATLALRTGAAIVPMFVTRDDRDQLTLQISPEVEITRTGDPMAATEANVALVSRHLEAMVLRYPDQWSWLGFRRNGNPSEEFDASEDAARAQKDSAVP